MPELRNISDEIAVVDADIKPRAISYRAYVRLQESLRRERRELLIFCGHPQTLTAGVKSREESLLISPDQLRDNGVAHVRIGRGGDYTAHEPGQCVIYPHIDLRTREIPVSHFFDQLLKITRESIEQTWGLKLKNNADAPGLYTIPVPPESESKKLASIGIMFKGFFSSFGVAVNVSNSLKTFEYINPCGDANLRMTTIEKLGGDPGLVTDFKDAWIERLRNHLHTYPRPLTDESIHGTR